MLVIFCEIELRLFNHSIMHKSGCHHSNARIQDEILQNPTQASAWGEDRSEVTRIVAPRRGKIGEEVMRFGREWEAQPFAS